MHFYTLLGITGAGIVGFLIFAALLVGLVEEIARRRRK